MSPRVNQARAISFPALSQGLRASLSPLWHIALQLALLFSTFAFCPNKQETKVSRDSNRWHLLLCTVGVVALKIFHLYDVGLFSTAKRIKRKPTTTPLIQSTFFPWLNHSKTSRAWSTWGWDIRIWLVVGWTSVSSVYRLWSDSLTWGGGGGGGAGFWAVSRLVMWKKNSYF